MIHPGQSEEKAVHMDHLIFGMRPQHDRGLDHGQRRRVGWRIRPSDLSEGMVDLWKTLYDPVGLLDQLPGLGDGRYPAGSVGM